MQEPGKSAAGLLARFNPAEDALLAWLQPGVSDELLEVIARADYGERAGENFEELKVMRDELALPEHNRFVWEVLTLTRWNQPEDPKWKPGLKGRDGHLIRAFCCAALVKAQADSKKYFEDTAEENTIIHLVESALALGGGAVEAALGMLSWRVLSMGENENARPLYALGILLLAASIFREEQDGPLLKDLGEWVIEEGDRLNERAGDDGIAKYRWIVGMDWGGFGEPAWIENSKKILVNPVKPHPQEAEEVLKLIGGMVVL